MLPRKFLSQIKWDRLKNDIRYVKDYAAKNKTPSRKEILSIRGFMVYASVNYDFMPPYLKVIHLSIEVWRPTRHSSGRAIEKEDYEDGPDPILFHLLKEKGIDLILPPPPE
jgi:hypothetical protein